jgi:hypothetical protein
MRQQAKQLRGRIEKLEAQRDELPAWCGGEHGQGHLMVVGHLVDLARRICQLRDPTWFSPRELLDEAWPELDRVGLAMLASGSYGNAEAIARTELAKWPRYQYTPSQLEAARATRVETQA